MSEPEVLQGEVVEVPEDTPVHGHEYWIAVWFDGLSARWICSQPEREKYTAYRSLPQRGGKLIRVELPE